MSLLRRHHQHVSMLKMALLCMVIMMQLWAIPAKLTCAEAGDYDGGGGGGGSGSSSSIGCVQLRVLQRITTDNITTTTSNIARKSTTTTDSLSSFDNNIGNMTLMNATSAETSGNKPFVAPPAPPVTPQFDYTDNPFRLKLGALLYPRSLADVLLMACLPLFVLALS